MWGRVLLLQFHMLDIILPEYLQNGVFSCIMLEHDFFVCVSVIFFFSLKYTWFFVCLSVCVCVFIPTPPTVWCFFFLHFYGRRRGGRIFGGRRICGRQLKRTVRSRPTIIAEAFVGIGAHLEAHTMIMGDDDGDDDGWAAEAAAASKRTHSCVYRKCDEMEEKTQRIFVGCGGKREGLDDGVFFGCCWCSDRTTAILYICWHIHLATF